MPHPQQFCCAITGELMLDPVMIKRTGMICDKSATTLPSSAYTPQSGLKQDIQAYRNDQTKSSASAGSIGFHTPVSMPTKSKKYSTGCEYDRLFKIRVIGDTGVGKSCAILRYVDDTYTNSYLPSIGVDFKVLTLDMNNATVKLQLWDTTGSNIPKSYSNYSCPENGYIFMFDLTDQVSFTNIKQWLKEADAFCESEGRDPKYILVATKADEKIRRVVCDDQIQSLIDSHPKLQGQDILLTSARTGDGIEHAFEYAVNKIEQTLPRLPKQLAAAQQPEPPKCSLL